MAKIGIVCDNFKVDMMSKELRAAGIVFSTTQYKKGITAFVCLSEQHLVKPIVDKVTQHFLDKKAKLN